ncbi:glutaredoxin 2 [Chloroherpeton thalassium ATCC 35110]|uniref:Glutaredoxin 2 n=1 Tax=Chloroherpeton thalassium (strain ATCC 35110 / GB-78) TaxID=517418 RepID=B3QUM7_CHLT3|nr:glutaredoxin family protein [Chloroherpeton thalassium]ACF12933.1 glutaredoxin 2 [Chloroherpeton thalassium ATCC 35110]
MLLVELYSKKGCCLCDEAKKVLLKVKHEIPFEFRETKIQEDEDLLHEYGTKIPVVFINGRLAFKYHVYELELKELLLSEMS